MCGKIVLGLAGRKGSGKTAVANLLVQEYGAVKSSFAEPLKQMLRTMGLTQDQLWGNSKEIPDFEILHGKTPRHAMQTLGTEWGRVHISPDLWAKLWAKMALVDQPTLTVVEDVRFSNEVAAIRSVGGLVLGIQRGKPSRWHSTMERLGFIHESENFQKLVKENHIQVIPNDHRLEDLLNRIMLEIEFFKEG